MAAAISDAAHRPVMLAEVLELLAPADGDILVDGTFGGGGTTRALLEAARCRVFAIDRDPAALAAGRALARRHGERLVLIEGRFSQMEALLASHGVTAVDGIALDLGVSSMQLDDPARGFSFRADGPLDMRMNRSGDSARDVVNHADEGTLADIIRRLGEERHARRLARAIVAARARRPIERTGELVEVIATVVPRGPAGSIHPVTRTFQALRIHVNDELGELSRGLSKAERVLRAGGRLAVISFHSLEDRLVKSFLGARGGQAPRPSRHAPPAGAERSPSFELASRGARRPPPAEVAANPRARSARLRGAVRTAAPAWDGEAAA